MANYEDIRAYFDESEPLRSAARNAARIPIVTGFTLDIDPLWSHFYDVENNLVDLAQAPLWASDPRFFLYERLVSPLGVLPLQPPDRGYRRRDLYKTVSPWKNETEAFHKITGRQRLPVILTIIHRPLRAPRSGQISENDDTSLLQQLVQMTRGASVLVRIEERPQARLAFASGDQITVPPATFGTLGGILNDRAGDSYGITCSHVAQKNDAIHDVTGNQIGVCVADTPRVSLANPQVCDPINLAAPNPIPGNGPDVNMLDCALIKLSSAVTHPTIAGVAQALSPGQSVILTGAVTRATRHWLGSLCLSYGFSSGGQNFCFRDSIELVPQPSGILGRTTVPTQGDSGGWVLTNDQPPEWAGLFFGEDGKRGFAVRAKWVHEWAQRTTSTTLTP
jgi:hypothetical protein